MNLMEGKTGIVMGVANERSIAWGIAKQLYLNKSNVILTYQNDNLKKESILLLNKLIAKIYLDATFLLMKILKDL